MKNLILIPFFLLTTLVFSKEKHFFIETSINNGFNKTLRQTQFIKSENITGYFLSTNVYLGYRKKGFSIFSGITNRIYFGDANANIKSDREDPITSGAYDLKKTKHFMVVIPVMFQYSLNLYNNKLFLNTGIGGDVNYIYKNNYNLNYFNKSKIAFGISATAGLTYSVSKLIDINFNFVYQRNLTSSYKDNLYGSDIKFIPQSFSNEMGIKFKL